MHYIQVACVVRHGQGSPYFLRYMREVVDRQLLIASITSEVGVWGDTRSSICAPERDGERFKLTKDATTVSYGEAADDLLVTCRRNPDSPPSHQDPRPRALAAIAASPSTTWYTLGMRGTGEPRLQYGGGGPDRAGLAGAVRRCVGADDGLYSHILWSAVWLGIASDAVAKASVYVWARRGRSPARPAGRAPPRRGDGDAAGDAQQRPAGESSEFDAIMQRPTGMDDFAHRPAGRSR